LAFKVCFEVMKSPSPVPSASGRKAQARRNDERILDAARKVLLANPEAPVSAVAREAGVGISALYLRYPSKNELLRRLCSEGLQRYIAETEAALADRGDVWNAYSGFMRRVVEADTHSLVLRLAGTFKPSKELYRQAEKAQDLTVRLFERVKAAGAMRSDIEVVDIALLFEQLAAVQIGGPQRTAQLRQRYLALIFDALRAPTTKPLPGPAPDWQDINSRWDK
jgi:AcrR family transcriptional regulator